MTDPRNEENEYSENDAMKVAGMDIQPEPGGANSDMSEPDMDDDDAMDDEDGVPGKRRATRLPGDTMAERE